MYIRRTISVLTAALSVGVCVFITYVSRGAWDSTILFNLVFLAIMLLALAAACFTGLRRLIGASRELQRAADTIRASSRDGARMPADTPLFQNAFLNDCYLQYTRMVRRNPNGSCDVQNYINEETIETYVHRGILESLPDILTSLGILGTFLGLVMGLRSFDPSGYEQMADSVTPLISGIKVAFITSIYGISLSLSFSFSLRSEFSHLTACLEEFLDAFYLNIRPPHEIDAANRLLARQKDQDELAQELTGIFVKQMAESFEQAITPAFDRMNDSFRQITDTFLQSQEALLTKVCESVTTQMRTELTADFEQIHRTVDALAHTQSGYTDFIDRTMLRMDQTLAALQDSMTQTQNALQDSLSKTHSYLTASVGQLSKAQDDAYRISQEQKEAYQDYIRFMYQSIEKFSEIWEKNSVELKHYSDELTRLGPVQSNLEMRSQLTKISERLQTMQNRLEAANSPADDSAETNRVLLMQTLQKLDELSDKADRPVFFRRRKK